MSLVKILCATAIAAPLLSFTTPGVADPGLLKIYQRNLAHQKLPKTKAAIPAKDFNGSTIEDSKRHRKKCWARSENLWMRSGRRSGTRNSE